MTKDELVRWLKKEKEAAIKRSSENIATKQEEWKEFYYESYGINEFAERVAKVSVPLVKMYREFFDHVNSCDSVKLSTYCRNWGDIDYMDIISLENPSDVKNGIIKALTFDYDHTYKKDVRELYDNHHKVESTYDTVIQTVKNLPTAKDGIEYLKKLGFDVSAIEPVKKQKQLPATISVNVDTRYLLLHKEKDDDRAEETNPTD